MPSPYPRTVTACPECKRRFVRTVHACRASVPDLGTWSARAGSAARHALEVARRERDRFDLGMVSGECLLWAFDLEARAHIILANLRERRSYR